MSVAKELLRGLTPRALAIGIIWTIAHSALWSIMWGFTNFGPDFNGTPWLGITWGFSWTMQYTGFPTVLFSLLLLWGLLSLLQKSLKFTSQELTIMYAMIVGPTYLASGFYSAIMYGLMHGPGVVIAGDPNMSWSFEDWPSFIVPAYSKEIYDGALYGGAAVPWNVWTPVMGFWFIHIFSYCCFFVFMAGLLRRMIIDVEALPFPFATAGYEVLSSATSTAGRPPLLKNKYLWGGFLVAFLLGIGRIIHFFMPSIPIVDLFADLSPILSISVVPWGVFVFNFVVWNIGIGYLLSTDILISATVAWIVMYMIMPALVTFMGIYPVPTEVWPYWMYWGSAWSWGSQSPAINFGYAPFWFGLIIGLVLWTFWLGKSEIARILRGLVKRMSSEEEAREALPYRYLWIGMIASMLVWWGTYFSFGTPLWYVIIYTILMVVVRIGFTVLRGQAGGTYGGYDAHLWGWYSVTLPALSMVTLGYNYSAPDAGWGAITHTLGSDANYWSGQYWQMPNSLESYKLASSTRTRPRDMLVSQILAYAVVILVTMPVFLYGVYQWGVLRDYLWSSANAFAGSWEIQWGNLLRRQATWQGGVVPPYDPVAIPWEVGSTVVGALIGVSFSALKMIWPAWPLNPVGIMCAMMTQGTVFPSWLVAFIAKKLTLRIGGTKLYEEKGVPLVTGMIAAPGLIMAVQGIGRIITKA